MVTFQQYHQANPHLYELYKAIAMQLIQQNRRIIGSAHIFQKMRYEYQFKTDGSPFKIDNNFAPHYARKFVLEHPQYGHLFKFKALKGVMLM
jgi:NAD-dependent DNA ligase